MPIQVAICEDEQLMREELERLVKMQGELCNIHTYDNGVKLLGSGQDFDIYFLDIQMDGLSGLDIARRIREKETGAHNKSVIVFITGKSQYMLDAFEVGAFHYLLKPIDSIRFTSVFEKAVEEYRRYTSQEAEYIQVKNKGEIQKVFYKDILFLESDDKKVIIHSTNRVIEQYAKMDDLERELGDSFFRCHRCYIVNLAHIIRYNANMIRLQNGDEIPLARKKHASFVDAYFRYYR